MSRKARLSENRFNTNAGVDLDAIAERCEERGSGVEIEELSFDEPPREQKGPRRRVIAQF